MSARPVWKKQNQLVEAEQLTARFIPEGLEEARAGLTEHIVYTLRTPFGLTIVPLGAWIIYDEEGVRAVPQAVFERLYKPVSIAGKAVALGERAVRRIIEATR